MWTTRSQAKSLLIMVTIVLATCSIGIYFWVNCLDNECEITELPLSFRQFGQRRFPEERNAPPLLVPLASKTLPAAGKATPEEELEWIWNYVYDRQYHCTESEYLGGYKVNGDGAYDLCIEDQFWPVRKSKDYKCLMYSFGVGGDFSFDDAVAQRGCEVHSFDPSENRQDGWVRKSGVTFHKVGISNEDNDNGFNGWKMKTLKTLMKELGHADRYLDYLKVDTDKHDGSGFEDVLMQELLDTGLHKCVRQYAMEIHMPSPINNLQWLLRTRLLYHQMTQLNKWGWRLYNTTDNVRFLQATIDKNYSQRLEKRKMLAGKRGKILWETAFVNFGVQGECGKYL